MPPRSKVLQLPSDVKAWLDKALLDSNFSGYQALEDELKAKGFSISRMAINRYSQDFEQKLAALKTSSEQARAFVEAVPDDAANMNHALLRLVQGQLFDLAMAQDGKYDLAKVAKATAETVRASVVASKFTAEAKARIAKEARESLLAEQEQKLEELRGSDGMSEQMESSIRRILLGKE